MVAVGTPPAQIPAYAANAPGSSLGSNVGCTRFEAACAPAHSRQSDRRDSSAQCPNHNREMGQGDPVRQHQAGLIRATRNVPISKSPADVRVGSTTAVLGRPPDTSAVPRIADDFGAPRK